MPTIRGRLFDQKFPLLRISISNQIAEFNPFDDVPGPANQRSLELHALIDTGATHSVFDAALLSEMVLPHQGIKDVLLAGMDIPTKCPSYACGLRFHEDPKHGGQSHEWIDWPDMIALNLENRSYRAIIGMDIIGNGTLHIERGRAIRFDF